jgi:hypothetical protein
MRQADQFAKVEGIRHGAKSMEDSSTKCRRRVRTTRVDLVTLVCLGPLVGPV